jgi:hypothetical protein
VQSYVNKYGTLYYLPEFGPPVRWLTTASRKSRGDDALAPAVYFFECDEKDLGRRAIQLWRDGRVALACPGGPDGDSLPEGALPNVDRWNADNPDIVAREITGEEFVSLWAALSRISIAICLASC